MFSLSQKGHKASKCRENGKRNQQNSKKPGNTHHLETAETEEKDMEECSMFTMTLQDQEPYRVEIELHRLKTCMEIDTGAAATNINEDTFKGIGKLKVKPATVKLRTYKGELVRILGTVNIMANYDQQKDELSALIVEWSWPNLIGRDWLNKVKLD